MQPGFLNKKKPNRRKATDAKQAANTDDSDDNKIDVSICRIKFTVQSQGTESWRGQIKVNPGDTMADLLQLMGEGGLFKYTMPTDDDDGDADGGVQWQDLREHYNSVSWLAKKHVDDYEPIVLSPTDTVMTTINIYIHKFHEVVFNPAGVYLHGTDDTRVRVWM